MNRNFSESAVQSTTNALPACASMGYQNHSKTRRLTSILNPVERITPKSVDTECKNDVSISDSSKSCEDVSLRDVKVELVNAKIWKRFHDVGNEMKVSKPGRRMFPTADFNLTGLLPNDVYKVGIAYAFADEFQYQFSRLHGTWSPSVKDDRVGEPYPKHRRYYEHPSSPTNGRCWTSLPLVFNKIAITNHLETPGFAKPVCLPTLRKYKIQLIITKLHCARCRGSHTRQIDIPLTDFITVTGYYNMKLTQLKIECNPAARYVYQKEQNKALAAFPESEQPKKQKNRKRKREENAVSRPPVIVISPVKSSHRDISSSHREISSSHREVSSSHREISSSHREISSHREVSSSHREMSSSHREISSSHREIPSSHREISSSHREMSSSHREISSSHREISSSALSTFSSTAPCSETSSATLSRYSSTSPGETSSATLSCCSPISSSSATLSGPYCYIDLTSTAFSVRQADPLADRLLLPPPLHHATTHACQSAEQFAAGSQIDYPIPGCPLTHFPASAFPSLGATPEAYVDGPATSNVEVNTLGPYNYMYNFNGNYLPRDNFHNLDFPIYDNYRSTNYDNYLGSNYDN